MANNLYKKLHIPKGRKGKLLLFATISAVVILVALLLILIFKQARIINPLAFKVGETGVTVAELDRYAELGSKYKVSRENVRSNLIQYHKYKILAERYDIDISEIYLDEAHNASAVEFGSTPSVLLAYADDNNDYTKIMSYIYAFNQRMSYYHTGGYAIVMFDFPYDTTNYLDDPLYAQYLDNPKVGDIIKSNLGAYSAETVKKMAEDLRAKVVSAEISDQDALKVIKDDYFLGSRSKFGLTFIALGGDEIKNGGSMTSTGPLYSGELLPKLKKMKPGVSEIYETKVTHSFYFIDYKFKIDKDADFPTEVKNAKAKIRVVEYDR